MGCLARGEDTSYLTVGPLCQADAMTTPSKPPRPSELPPVTTNGWLVGRGLVCPFLERLLHQPMMFRSLSVKFGFCTSCNSLVCFCNNRHVFEEGETKQLHAACHPQAEPRRPAQTPETEREPHRATTQGRRSVRERCRQGQQRCPRKSNRKQCFSARFERNGCESD